MKAPIPLPYPVGGLDQNLAFSEQPPRTTRAEKNMRVQDPRTGRLSGAQRSGLERLSEDSTGNSKVRELTAVMYDAKRVTYSVVAASSATVPEWSYTLPSESDGYGVQTGRQSDVFALDGDAGVVRLTSEGAKLWSLRFPIQDDAHKVRALHVDEFDRIYAAVSEGGDQDECRVWCYVPDDDTDYRKLWELEVAFYVEEIVVRDGIMYLACNYANTYESEIRAYFGIDTANPSLDWSRPGAYPMRALDVNADGEVCVSSPGFADRLSDPTSPLTTKVWVDLSFEQVVASERKQLWAHYRADTIEGEEGDKVLAWRDISGNGRHLFVDTADQPPTLAVGLGGRKCVKFNGVDQSLRSEVNSSISPSHADEQRTILPAYTGAAFACFIVARPEQSTTNRGAILSQKNDGPANFDRIITSNRSGTGGFGVLSGGVTHNDRVTGTLARADAQGRFDNASDACVLTAIQNGNGLGGGTGGIHEDSYWRVNGWPLARYRGAETRGMGASFVGRQSTVRQWFYSGEVYEILVYRDSTKTPLGAQSYLLENPGYPTAGYSAVSETEVEKIEGILAWYYGIAHLLDDGDGGGWGAGGASSGASGADSGFEHPYTSDVTAIVTSTLAPPGAGGRAAPGANPALLSVEPVLAKYGPNANTARWAFNASGVGAGCRFGSHGDVYTVGALDSSGSDFTTFRRVQDDGDSFALTGGTAWAKTLHATESWDYERSRMSVDTFDNVWIPYYETSVASVPYPAVLGYAEDGTQILDLKIKESRNRAHAIAFDPAVPDYDSDLSGTQRRPEFVYVAGERMETGSIVGTANAVNNDTLTIGGQAYTYKDTLTGSADEILIGAALSDTLLNTARAIDAGAGVGTLYGTGTSANASVFALEDEMTSTALPCITKTLGTVVSSSATGTGNITGWGLGGMALSSPALWKFRLVAATVDTAAGSPRVLLGLSVNDGEIRKFDVLTGTVTPFVPAATVIDPDSWYIQSATIFQKVYWADGLKYWVFDPKLDTVVEFKAAKGKIEPRCQLIAPWRGRLVVARAPDNPHNWFMSAHGDVTDFNFHPTVPTSTMAVAGNGPFGPGVMPDVITCLAPYSKDHLLVGCDHSIYMFRGDPAAGGVIELVSDITGMAFGQPFARDPDGVFYFVGSRGGLWAMYPGMVPKEISKNRVDRLMAQYDFSARYVRALWNDADDCLHIFQFSGGPSGESGEITEHLIWERKADAFHVDTFGSESDQSVQPSGAIVMDGDLPGDRVLVVGCEDGFLRTWSPSARDDDGHAIYSEVLFGPLRGDEFHAVRWTRLRVLLADHQDGCKAEVFVSDSPALLGRSVFIGMLHAGDNPFMPVRARGQYVWVKLQNVSPDSRWGLESMGISAVRAGRRRA